MSVISYAMKKKIDKVIRLRGDKFLCFYCECTFSAINPAEYEHLNNNPSDNRPENIVYACHSCNNKKKFNFDLQIMAQEKLESNEKAVLMRERRQADSGTKIDLSSQQEINKTNTQITDQFLLEHTLHGESFVLKDGVDAIVNICQENNGTGSQSAVYRYLDYKCNPINGKYTIFLNSEGKNAVRRRTEN